MSIEIENAIDDFIAGSGSGKPPFEVCTTLLETDRFKKNVIEAVNKGAKSISFQPYGEQMVIVYDPVYIGPYSTAINYKTDDGEIIVYFDRN